MTDPKNDHSNDLSLEMDYKSGDDSVPPSGKFPKDAIRGVAITIAAAIASFVLFSLLNFDPMVNKGLALAVFIGTLWLTEAIHVTATAF